MFWEDKTNCKFPGKKSEFLDSGLVAWSDEVAIKQQKYKWESRSFQVLI